MNDDASYIDDLRRRQQQLDDSVSQWLRRNLAGRALRDANDDRLRLIQSVLDWCRPEHLSHGGLRRVLRQRMTVVHGLSLHRDIVADSEVRALGARPPAWKLDNKIAAYRFIDEIGVRRPSSSKHSTFADLSVNPPCVVKHVRSSGGVGVYLLKSHDHIVHACNLATFDNQTTWTAHADRLMSGRHELRDRWFVEQFIADATYPDRPARDLKFYTSYGEVTLASIIRAGSTGG